MMREALLETAIDHFGRLGFEGAATRAIAADSGTAMSSITYHFGGKEGLYLAAADHIVEQIGTFHGAALARLGNAGPDSPEQAADMLVALLDSFAVMMLSEKSARFARFIIREQQQPTEAFERIFTGAMQPIIETVIGLLRVARPDLEPEDARISAMLIWGQAIGFRAARASACRVLEVETIDEQTAAQLRRRLAVHTRAILAGDLNP